LRAVVLTNHQKQKEVPLLIAPLNSKDRVEEESVRTKEPKLLVLTRNKFFNQVNSSTIKFNHQLLS